MITDLKGSKVTVMGLGQLGGGEGAVRWLCEQGARVLVTDLKTEQELAEIKNRLIDCPELEWHLGEHQPEWFTQADLVVRNPAVRSDSKWLKMARMAGVPIEMDSSLLIRYAPTKNIFAITGTKGKTTTAHFIGHILRSIYAKVWMIGVDGESLLGNLSKIKSTDAIVVELSSWRLEALAEHNLNIPVVVVTSLYPDHLNTYESLEDYYAVKRSVVALQNNDQLALLNYDDPNIRKWEDTGNGRKYWFSRSTVPQNGIGCEANKIVYVKDGIKTEICKISDLPDVGAIGQMNLLPGIFLAMHFGVIEKLRLALKSWTGVPHRQEIIAENKGVTFVNDSAATIPEASCAALEHWHEQKIVLIAGGNNKGLKYDNWAKCVMNAKLGHIIWLPGDATNIMQDALRLLQCTVPMTAASTIEDAVQLARDTAQAGEVVLMSPGATSFGSFKNEFERGEAFKKAVLQLKYDAE